MYHRVVRVEKKHSMMTSPRLRPRRVLLPSICFRQEMLGVELDEEAIPPKM